MVFKGFTLFQDHIWLFLLLPDIASRLIVFLVVLFAQWLTFTFDKVERIVNLKTREYNTEWQLSSLIFSLIGRWFFYTFIVSENCTLCLALALSLLFFELSFSRSLQETEFALFKIFILDFLFHSLSGCHSKRQNATGNMRQKGQQIMFYIFCKDCYSSSSFSKADRRI